MSGSFVNALVWRIYLQEQLNAGKRRLKSSAGLHNELSIVKGRSVCINCRHKLSSVDLIPVLSWLSLRGRCRYCAKPISWQYPVVELVTASLFILSYLLWPDSLALGLQSLVNFSAWLVLLVGFIALVVYDIRWMLLPNRLVYPMTILALVLAIFNIAISPGIEIVYFTILSVAISGGLFYLIFQISSGRWIGGGDVKLGLLIGLLLQDPYKAVLMLMTASVLGTLFIIPGMAVGKVSVKSRIPFGPFLIIATMIAYLFGSQIINWYKHSILLI